MRKDGSLRAAPPADADASADRADAAQEGGALAAEVGGSLRGAVERIAFSRFERAVDRLRTNRLSAAVERSRQSGEWMDREGALDRARRSCAAMAADRPLRVALPDGGAARDAIEQSGQPAKQDPRFEAFADAVGRLKASCMKQGDPAASAAPAADDEIAASTAQDPLATLFALSSAAKRWIEAQQQEQAENDDGAI